MQKKPKTNLTCKQMLIRLSADCKFPDNIGVKGRITERNVSVLALFHESLCAV